MKKERTGALISEDKRRRWGKAGAKLRDEKDRGGEGQ